MNLRGVGDYNVGLDLGTGSVGWVATDADGEMLRFKSKPTWGSRIYPNASTAADARAKRGQRRRYIRRRWRLDLLQSLFADEMALVDDEFFIRLKQSRLYGEDRAEGHAAYRWPLFNASDFTERDYYKQFPTVYHLRAWLMETDEKADLRLIYLAFHNIVKTRGNFLHQDNPGLCAEKASMGDSVEALCSALAEWCDANDLVFDFDARRIQDVLDDPLTGRRVKQRELEGCFGLQGDAGKKLGKQLSLAIVGYSAEFAHIFFEEAEGSKLSLSDDEKVDKYLASIADEGLPLFEAIRSVYSSYILSGILSVGDGSPVFSAALQGSTGKTISYCKVREYEQYKRDLAQLKGLVRTYAPSRYASFFRGGFYAGTREYDPGVAEGYTKYNVRRAYPYEDFKKSVEKLLAKTKAVDDPRYIDMMARFEEGRFLRRLKTSDNGSIPYQLHLEEMDAIIRSQGRFYPFLLEGREKLEALVSFRIPYYVGPLTQKNAAADRKDGLRFAWAERLPGKEDKPVYPWNWDQVIDKNGAAHAFIKRMTSDCTYLLNQPVVPKCSLVYEEFCVLNELNGARWTTDGDDYRRFDYADRMGIIDELFRQKRTVTYKAVADWMRRCRNWPNVTVAGGQGETKFESGLSSYRFFCKDVFRVDELPTSLVPMVETIILWNTLFEDRSILRDELKRAFGDRLSDAQIKTICKKRFTGWGKLSDRFLTGIKVETDNGPKSIMDILREGNPNAGASSKPMVLMEVLHDDRLGFEKRIEEENEEVLLGAEALTVDDLPGSPSLRRTVNQAVRIVEEISRIAGHVPTSIFIENTRDDNPKKKGGRTQRRYKKLKEAIEAFKVESQVALDFKQVKPAELDDERLLLYFMQGGKSLYSGKALDMRNLSQYQVDHIIPQSYIKDDSLENKALVLSSENQAKANDLLISPQIRQKMAGYWRTLHQAGLIGEKKLDNLMCSSISERRIKGFIARQLVETSQIVKLTKLMLESKYPETRVLPVRASLSHDLRDARGYVKCREINDFHHAHDALLAAEMGRFILTCHAEMYDNPIGYAHVVKDFVRSQAQEMKATGRIPGGSGFIVSSFMRTAFDRESGEVLWDSEFECERIRKYLNCKQVFLSRMPEVTSGAFWDATIYSPKSAGRKLALPLKRGLDPKKYGSYSSEKYAYFACYYARNAKGKRLVDFMPVPVARCSGKQVDIEELARETAEQKGYLFESVAREKIAVKQLIEVDGCRLFITGGDQVRSAIPIALTQEQTKQAKALFSDEEVDEATLDSLFGYYVASIKRYDRRLYDNLKLDTRTERFAAISHEDKQLVIKGLIALSSAKNNMCDLRPLGGAKTAGQLKIKFGNVLTKSGITFIDQSVTGMFERRTHIGL